jgi:hypothetical protein
VGLRAEKDGYVYRSYISLRQYSLGLGEIVDSTTTPISLQSLKMLASCLSKIITGEVAILFLQEMGDDPSSANNTTLQLVTALIQMHEGNTNEAITAVRHGTTLEQ